jgi:hypothetical protein
MHGIWLFEPYKNFTAFSWLFYEESERMVMLQYIAELIARRTCAISISRI